MCLSCALSHPVVWRSGLGVVPGAGESSGADPLPGARRPQRAAGRLAVRPRPLRRRHGSLLPIGGRGAGPAGGPAHLHLLSDPGSDAWLVDDRGPEPLEPTPPIPATWPHISFIYL